MAWMSVSNKLYDLCEQIIVLQPGPWLGFVGTKTSLATLITAGDAMGKHIELTGHS